MDPRAVGRPQRWRRPRRWPFTPAPTCTACERSWPRSARFCGWCGALLPARNRGAEVAHPPTAGGGVAASAARAVLTHAPAIGASAALVVVAAVLVAIVGGRGPALEVASVPDDATDLPDPATPRDARASRTTVCLEDGVPSPACVVPLVPQHVSRGMLAPLPPDSVLVGQGDEVRRYEVTSGLLTWRARPLAEVGGLRLRVAEDAVVVSRHGEVAMLEPEDGSTRWTRPLPNPAARAAPRIWLLHEDVFVLDTARVLHALDGQDGSLRWSLDAVSPEVIATEGGLLVNHAGELGLWRPDTAMPIWTRDVASLAPLRLNDERPVTTPVRLLFGRDLLVPETGETLEVPGPGPTTTRVLDHVTLVFHWPDPETLELTGIGPGGQVAWQRTDLTLPCCLASAVEASGARIVLGPVTGPFELLDQYSGASLGSFDRPGATLDGVAGDLVLWREYERLIGTDLATGAEVFHGWGSVRSLEPLLISGPEGLIHVIPPEAG